MKNKMNKIRAKRILPVRSVQDVMRILARPRLTSIPNNTGFSPSIRSIQISNRTQQEVFLKEPFTDRTRGFTRVGCFSGFVHCKIKYIYKFITVFERRLYRRSHKKRKIFQRKQSNDTYLNNRYLSSRSRPSGVKLQVAAKYKK